MRRAQKFLSIPRVQRIRILRASVPLCLPVTRNLNRSETVKIDACMIERQRAKRRTRAVFEHPLPVQTLTQTSLRMLPHLLIRSIETVIRMCWFTPHLIDFRITQPFQCRFHTHISSQLLFRLQEKPSAVNCRRLLSYRESVRTKRRNASRPSSLHLYTPASSSTRQNTFPVSFRRICSTLSLRKLP